MEYLTPEMFTEDGIEKSLELDIKRKETLEYQLEDLRSQTDSIKSTYFKELLVYERMKKQDPNLIPNKDVLNQLKELSRDPRFNEIKSSMDSMSMEIKQIEEKIESAKNKLGGLFKFHDIDVKNYADKYETYIKTRDKEKFVELMEFIFSKEFKNAKLYIKAHWQRNVKIFMMLVEKAPKEFQTVMKYIVEDEIEMAGKHDYEYMKMMNFGPEDLIRYHKLKLNSLAEGN